MKKIFFITFCMSLIIAGLSAEYIKNIWEQNYLRPAYLKINPDKYSLRYVEKAEATNWLIQKNPIFPTFFCVLYKFSEREGGGMKYLEWSFSQNKFVLTGSPFRWEKQGESIRPYLKYEFSVEGE